MSDANLSYSDTLRGYVEQMGVMDNVGSLAQSDDYRKMLMDVGFLYICICLFPDISPVVTHPRV